MAFAKFKVKKGLSISNEFITNSYDAIPVGLILPYTKNTAPDGWLMCDGTSTSGYTDLAALVGATTPNLNGNIIIGSGTGSGNGSSGTGVISGTALTARTINTVASSVSTSPMVDFSHNHNMGNHSHSLTHTHNYPHTHSNPHNHTAPHSHPGTGGSSLGGHQHAGFFGTTANTGSLQKFSPVSQPTATFGTSANVGHTHVNTGDSTDSGTSPSGTNASGNGTASTFIATGTTTTATDNTTTGSFGSVSSPAGAFPIVQPTIGVYYIIKY